MTRLKNGASDTRWRGTVRRTEGNMRMQRIRRASVVFAMAALAVGILASSASAFPKYAYTSSFGSEGSGPGQFKKPEGMTSDSAGNVYVADYSNNRIEKFNSKGEFLKEFGKPKLNRPMDVAIDSKGNFWVTQETDTESVHKVVKLNSNGEYLSTFGPFGEGNGQFWRPERIDIDSKDNIWISDTGGAVARLQEFNSEGKYLRQINETTVGKSFYPGSLAIDSKDNVWAVDWSSRDLFEFNPEGKYIGQLDTGLFNLASNGLEIDALGRIWVSAGNEISNYLLVFNAGGEMLGQVGELEPGGVLFQPEDIVFDPSGNPWVRNYTNSKVMKWLPLPDATTKAATEVGPETTLNAEINPNGLSTSYQFEYGTTASYGNSIPASPESIGSGSSGVAVSKTIGGLTAGTTYHFRVTATNAAGATYGMDKEFTTTTLPVNKSLPQLTQAVPAEAVPVSTSNGKWGETPTFTYQWRRCNAEGAECANISGATAATYTPVSADVEHTLVSAVTATNSWGSATAYSKATAKIKPLGQITEFSLPSGGHPSAITNGPGDGNLWYTGGVIGDLAKMTTSGTVTEYPIEKSGPAGIMSGVGGKVWFAGIYNVVGNMTTTGTVTEYPTAKGNVVDVAAVGGKAWFTATSGMVGSVTKVGELTEYSVSEMSPNKVTAGPDGNVWFTESIACVLPCKIGKMTTGGGLTKYSLPSGIRAYDIAAGPDGNLWFTVAGGTEGKIGKITTSGVVTMYTIPGGGSPYPRGITAGADGSLWFAESVASKIGRITTAGSISTYSLPAGSEPYDIAQGPDAMLWFTNYGTNKIGTIVP